MMLAAKHLDPVLGIDIHFVQPPGPVPPVPVPHPYVGILFDPFDYAPVIGATVKVNGLPRGQAGTQGKGAPTHVPLGGSFVKPPTNESEMFMGSGTVCVDGDAFSYLALPALSCQDIGMVAPARSNPKKRSRTKSLVLPLSIVLPIPRGAPVVVGGPPTISLMALGMPFALAGLAGAFRKLAKSGAATKTGRAWKKASERLHAGADALLTRLGLSANSRARNAIHRTMCKVVGHPIDVATGKLFTELVDFEQDEVLPIRWERVWYSSSTYRGPLGHGWHHSYDLGLAVGDAAVALRLPDGRGISFPSTPLGSSHFDELEGLTLSHEAGGYVLRAREGRSYRFAPVGRAGEQSPVTIVNETGRSIRLSYDPTGVLCRIENAAGRTLLVFSDACHRISEIRLLDTETGPDSRLLVRYSYNADGDLVAAANALEQPFCYEYAHHLLVRETNRNDYSFFFAYDRADATARCVATWGEDGLHSVDVSYGERETVARFGDGGEWCYLHDGRGSVTQLTDPHGGVTQYILDDVGRVAEEIDPNNNVTTLEYDETGAHVRRVNSLGFVTPPEYIDPDPPDPNSYELPGTALEWEHGELASRARTSEPDPWIVSQLPSDVRSALVQIRLARPAGVPTDHHDLLGRTVRREHPDGSLEQWGYDGEGNALSYRDRDGVSTTYLMASRDLQVGETDALGHTTRLAYSRSEEVTRLVDAGGTEHRFVYDLKNRNTEIWMGGTLHQTYVYDKADNLVERRDGLGRTLVRWEVGRGNVDARRILADGEVHEFAYDEAGRIRLAAIGDIRAEFAHNAEGVQIRDLRNGLGVEHRFDPNGLLSRTSYLRRFHVRYARDESDPDTIHIVDPTGARHTLLLGSNGEVLRRLANGTSELAAYDDEGRCVLKRTWREDGRGTGGCEYVYSPGGMLLEARDVAGGATHFDYDAARRLKHEHRANGGGHEYVFDAAGNLLAQPGLRDVTIAPGNMLTAANGDSFEHDEQGRLSVRQGRCGRIEYGHNALDLLTSMRINGEAWSATYDPLCRRVSKTWRGETREHWWDNFRLAAETLPGGALRLYIYADHAALVPLMFVDYPSKRSRPADGTRYFIFTNQVGAPTRVEDGTGKPVWAARIDPFGSAHVTVGHDFHMPLRFPGHYWDAETGLHYNRFRHYSPELARFTELDPLGPDGGINLYTYCANPATDVDIDGLTKCTGKTKVGAKSRRTVVNAKKKGWTRTLGGVPGKTGGPSWSSHGGKHLASRKVPWRRVVEGTKSGPAKYRPGTAVEALERQVWAEGNSVTTGKPWKVMEFDQEVGASGGQSSRWVRVEESGGTIHGHPITESEFLRLTK